VTATKEKFTRKYLCVIKVSMRIKGNTTSLCMVLGGTIAGQIWHVAVGPVSRNLGEKSLEGGGAREPICNAKRQPN
jgi:hypothetical protein